MNVWPYNFLAYVLGLVFISLAMWLIPDVRTKWGMYAFFIGFWLIHEATR